MVINVCLFFFSTIDSCGLGMLLVSQRGVIGLLLAPNALSCINFHNGVSPLCRVGSGHPRKLWSFTSIKECCSECTEKEAIAIKLQAD